MTIPPSRPPILPRRRHWDPIGVYQGPQEDQAPPGEYDTYAGWITKHLYQGTGRGAILADMLRARELMGVANTRLGDADAADRVLEWWDALETH